MANWLIYTPSSGTLDGTVTLTASTLSELKDRVATLIARNDEYMVQDSAEITQSFVTGISIDNLVWVSDVSSSGGTATSANCSFIVYKNYHSGHKANITSLATVSGSLNVPSSTTQSRHSVGDLTLTASFSGYTASATVTAYQAAFIPASITGITLTNLTVSDVPASGATVTSANCSYNVYALYDDGTSSDITNSAVISGSLVIPPSTTQERHSAGTLTLTATYGGYSSSASAVVYQEAFVPAALTGITINNLSVNGDVQPSGATITSADCSFNVFGYYDDGSSYNLTNSAVVSGSLTVPASTATTRHSAGTLTLTATYGGFSATASTIVYQEAYGYNDRYLTMNVITSGRIKWNKSSLSAPTLQVSYSKNNGTWITIIPTALGILIDTDAGDVFRFRGENTTYAESAELLNSISGSTGTFTLEGNIMSLIAGDNFASATVLPSAYAFYGLFSNCTGLTSAENLVLPATSLSENCYQSMFIGCTSLTTAPELPATELTNNCYTNMFSGCTSLASVPRLPATTLAPYCYTGMFRGCTGLVNPPAIAGVNLASYACYSMFENCTSLETTPILPATTMAEHCYDSMFIGCTSLATAHTINATTLATSCCYQMFKNCSSLTSVPTSLPATALTLNCYQSMFENCTSLTSAPELPATELSTWCYRDMFKGCTALTTAPALPATTLTDECYVGMFKNCISIYMAPDLPATTLASNCYAEMFLGCTGLISAPDLPATTLANACYSNMFIGCTGLVIAPELPAPILVPYCYMEMFYGCSSLKFVECLATDVSSTDCTNGWLYGVAATGTFLKDANMNDWPSGSSGIPNGWTVMNT